VINFKIIIVFYFIFYLFGCLGPFKKKPELLPQENKLIIVAPGISNEWELCTAEEFENTDVLMHAIITNPEYKIPQLAPDGNYCPNNTILLEDNLNRSLIKTIDILGRDNQSNIFYLEIYDDGSIEKKYILNK